MAKRKESRKAVSKNPQLQPTNGEALRKALAWVLDGGIFNHLQKHGNTSWAFADLVLLAVVWTWPGNESLTGSFLEAHHWSMKVLGYAALDSYQGFIKAVGHWTKMLLPLIWKRLHELMEAQGEAHWRVGLWLALAVDGSRISVPRSAANEKALCAPNFGNSQTAKSRRKKKQGQQRVRRKSKKKVEPVKPQIWLTMVWHMGLQMAWNWKSGPSTSSERDHLRLLLDEQEFPENTLFCADAGFTGYDFWSAIRQRGHHLLIRVGKNVRLLRKLGYVRERAGIVYFWPDHAAHKKQPPLVFRLLRFQVGKCDMHLVTSVLSKDDLTDKQALELYRRRWGIELQFRTLKQTFGRRKLRSLNPDNAYVELDWSLVGLWMIQLLAVKEQMAIGVAPRQCSVCRAIEVIRTTIQQQSERPVADETFVMRLQAAVKDPYKRKRSKQARYKPNFKDKPAAGKPTILTATAKHKLQLSRYLNASL
jgi:hypothetical protein